MTAMASPACPEVELSPHRSPFRLGCKRWLDIALSATALLVTSPVLVAAGIGVKASSPGPMLYRWRIVGERGRPLTSYKFRTMVPGADALKATLLQQNEMSGPVFKMKDDPRVTRFGRILRKTSIDELPQLWSVLKGELSLVGPRPPLQSEYLHFTLQQRQKLAVKPGITCLWQVNGRNVVAEFDQWLAMDLEYIQNWTLWLDVKVLLATIPAVLRGVGAR